MMRRSDPPGRPVRVGTAYDASALQLRFDQLLDSSARVRMLIGNISSAGAKGVVFGGWVRDHIAGWLLKRDVEPADVDFVVTGVSRGDLHALLPTGTRINAFGGYVVHLDDVRVDIWCVQDTHTMLVRGMEFDVDLLPLTTVFDIEAVVFKPMQWWQEPTVLDCGAYDALARGVIGMGLGEVRFPVYQAGRALQYSSKLDLSLGDDVAALVRETLRVDGPERIAAGIRALGHPPLKERALLHLRQAAEALAAGAPIPQLAR